MTSRRSIGLRILVQRSTAVGSREFQQLNEQTLKPIGRLLDVLERGICLAVRRNQAAEHGDVSAKDGQRGAHLVRGIRREAVHRLLKTLGLERAGAQGFERLRHAAELIGTPVEGTASSKSRRLRRAIAAVRIFIGRAKRRCTLTTAKTPKAMTEVRSIPATSKIRNDAARMASACVVRPHPGPVGRWRESNRRDRRTGWSIRRWRRPACRSCRIG